MKRYNFQVVGMSYRLDNLRTLAEEDSDYFLRGKEFIEEYEGRGVVNLNWFNPKLFGQVDLIPEPSNPHDPNAVRVEVAGTHIGYIKSGSCSQVKNLLASGAKVELTEIHYGPAKWTYEDEDGQVRIATKNRPPFAQVTLTIGAADPEPAQEQKPKKKKSAAMIACMVIGAIIFLAGLLLLLASPVTGIIIMAVAVAIMVYARIYYGGRK